ncbi:hypothetical protein [Sinorhizobium sp. BG8]|uniref:hypothetical protein n=1 Tax=Sinorhizobium sp. BG8 TaxID=2613773 RepID=UPI00193D7859|nr:hypothetical protein [Sinorhizobium sp. BG8]
MARAASIAVMTTFFSCLALDITVPAVFLPVLLGLGEAGLKLADGFGRQARIA